MNNKDTIEAVVQVNPVLCKLYSKTIINTVNNKDTIEAVVSQSSIM